MTISRLLILIPAILLAACASSPDYNPQLAELEQRLERDQAEPEIRAHAAAELAEADKRLDRARLIFEDDGVTPAFTHNLQLGDRWLDIAETKAELMESEARAQALAERRDEIVLEARLTRAELARLTAEAEARLARDRAQAATAEADAMRYRAEAESRRADQRTAALAEEIERTRSEARAAEQRATAAMAAREAAEARADRISAELAQLQADFRELDARKTDPGLVLTLDDVLFEFDRADLKPGALRELRKVAEFLHEHPERKIRVEGFTDSIGSENYNRQLSEARARAVEDALMSEGITRERIVSVGYGEDYPVATNNTEAGRQQNRRVEIVISTDAQAVEDRVAIVD